MPATRHRAAGAGLRHAYGDNRGAVPGGREGCRPDHACPRAGEVRNSEIVVRPCRGKRQSRSPDSRDPEPEGSGPCRPAERPGGGGPQGRQACAGSEISHRAQRFHDTCGRHVFVVTWRRPLLPHIPGTERTRRFHSDVAGTRVPAANRHAFESKKISLTSPPAVNRRCHSSRTRAWRSPLRGGRHFLRRALCGKRLAPADLPARLPSVWDGAGQPRTL